MITNYDIMKLMQALPSDAYQQRYVNELTLKNIQAIGKDEASYIMDMLELAYKRGQADALERAKNIPITWD